MKKKTISLLFVLLFVVLTGCRNDQQTEAKTAVTVDQYSATQLKEKGFLYFDSYEKEGQLRKTETLFGKTWNMSYSTTLKSNYLPCEMDMYTYNSSAQDFVFVATQYRTDTGGIVKYSINPSPETYEGSSINSDSSEEAIVSYAKNVLFDVTGESTDGWNVRIQETRFPYYTPQKMGPLYARGYTVTFFKTIGGVERADSMYVQMTDAGEIVELNAIHFDDCFTPFKNVNLDVEAIKRTATDAFSKDASGRWNYEISNIDVSLYVSGDSLWALVQITYQTGEAYGGVEYSIEVARLE